MFTADCGFTLFLLFLPLDPIFFCLSADELLFLWVNPILIVCTDSDPHIFTLSVKAIQKQTQQQKIKWGEAPSKVEWPREREIKHFIFVI